MSKTAIRRDFRIVAVVISYNNERELRTLIPALLAQSYPLKEIVVVDNASSDATIRILNEEFSQITLLANSSNLGVGKGYARGMEYAYENKYDWIWLLDGDGLAQVAALEELIKAFNCLKDIYPKIGILASSPVNHSTGVRYEGMLWHDRFVKVPKKLASYQEPFLVDTMISSGSLIHRKVIKDVGLPRADFFIDFVDHEYNLRLRKEGYQIVYVPRSIIYHELGNAVMIRSITHLGREAQSSIHPPWRMYYMTRNELYTYVHISWSPKAFSFLAMKAAKQILSVMIHNEGDRVARLKYIALGLRDGLKGRLGRTIKPPNDRG